MTDKQEEPPPRGTGKKKKPRRAGARGGKEPAEKKLAAFRQSFSEITAEVAGAIQEKANVRAIYGEPFRLEERTAAPVGRVHISLTGGAGFGEGLDSGGGGGNFALDVEPVGYLFEKDGEVVFKAINPAPRPSGFNLNLAEYLPYLLKFIERIAPVRIRRRKGRGPEEEPRGDGTEENPGDPEDPYFPETP